MVVGVEKRSEIDEIIGEKPGHPAYMGLYAKASNEVLENLSEETKREYMELGRKWNNSRPPRDVRMR
jgi:hypothetical protein